MDSMPFSRFSFIGGSVIGPFVHIDARDDVAARRTIPTDTRNVFFFFFFFFLRRHLFDP